MSYEFKKQVNEPRQKEAVKLYCNYLRSEGCEIQNVSEDKNYYSLGIDIIKNVPNGVITMDVKTDFLAHKTGNLPFEVIEIASVENNCFKEGWGNKKGIDRVNEIVYFIWETKGIIVIELYVLQELAWNGEWKNYASYHKEPFYYFTCGFLIPIEKIKERAINVINL